MAVALHIAQPLLHLEDRNGPASGALRPARGERVHDEERAILDAALAERARAPRRAPSGPAELALMRYIAPPIQQRVYQVLSRHAHELLRRDARANVEDLVQQVLCHLFEEDARALRAWDPDREGSLSLKAWVAFVTTNRVLDQVRVKKQFDRQHVPSEPETLEQAGPDRPDASVEAEDLWSKIQREVLAQQSELGRRLFQWLIVEDRTNAEVRGEVDLSDDAIYQWRRRLRQGCDATWRRSKGEP